MLIWILLAIILAPVIPFIVEMNKAIKRLESREKGYLHPEKYNDYAIIVSCTAYLMFAFSMTLLVLLDSIFLILT